MKAWFDLNTEQFSNASVLHFAAEPAVTRFIKPACNIYKTADIQPGRCDLILNIEKIDMHDQSFDIIICSHVLEHVNDRLALAELFRILRPGGTLVLMFPLIEGWKETYENATIVSDDMRTLHFGQYDHVRYFGADVRRRIRDARFELVEFTPVEPLVSAHGLMRGETVFLAKKSNAS